jgi:uncharacterized protein (TIGR00304 family)
MVGEHAVADLGVLSALGLGLIFIGVFLIVVATILIAIFQGKKGKVKAAGAVIIGPVPIIFGSDKKSVKTILALSITLTALLIVAMVVYYLLLR